MLCNFILSVALMIDAGGLRILTRERSLTTQLDDPDEVPASEDESSVTVSATEAATVHDEFEAIASSEEERQVAGLYNDETISGDASTMENTKHVRRCLGKWIKKYDVKFLLDASCGDANWQAKIPGIHDITYRGYDVSETAVKLAEEKNAKHPDMTFHTLNLVNTVPRPPEKPDLILMKDILQQLPLHLGLQLLKNAKQTEASYIAVTNFNQEPSNTDIDFGTHRKNFYSNNVYREPFCMPKGVQSCKDAWGDAETVEKVSLELIELSEWDPPESVEDAQEAGC
eukprot:gnl/TRDRNA2_/TRDRNA2_197636_c0_seq1.p1 gnl/TRDRNA2_/TRDRNA2_197636_c0~~gnl/TRDRNA2_/TRDRNA2_197636_c0_seq1.p1  ORF type:complete len:285 (-),score=34.23 gnl/TRDRNA2_/TRDRNA2_197636_c0_seq1:112-966(-)